jgi:endoribonuclease Nob1
LRVLVLDTSAFIMGFNPSPTGHAYTVDAVENELSLGTIAQMRFRLSKEKGDLTVRPPSSKARETVESLSGKTGERGYLSQADRDVVALALELKGEGLEPVIVSDDYAVQNLAEHMGLGYGSLANFGIVHRFEWVMYCPACHRRFKSPEKDCQVCGTRLKRRVLSKSRVAKDRQIKERA